MQDLLLVVEFCGGAYPVSGGSALIPSLAVDMAGISVANNCRNYVSW